MPQEVDTTNLPNPNGPLPLADYIVQVLDVKQEPSKKFSPMDTFECQILAPDTVESEGETVRAAGRKFTIYSAYSLKSLFFAKQNLAKLGIEVPAKVTVPTEDEVQSGAYKRIPEIQDETLALRGKTFGLRLSTRPRLETENGRWDGPVKRDAAGNPVVIGHDIDAKLDNVVSPAVDGGMPY